MKEIIQKNAEEVAIVIYDSPLPPKYFRLTKKFIRTLFFVVPLLLSLLFIGLLFWGLGSRLKDSPTPSLPQVLPTMSESKVQSLEAEIKGLQETNQALTEKLSGTPAVATAEDPFLMVIKKPYGMQNLISQNKVTLDQFEFVHDKEKVNFKFQIISSTPETKVTGHVLVFMISQSGVMGYPADTNTTLLQGVKYSQGEPFAVSRLRPTNAEFNHQLAGANVKFVIYIFSREGDLLLIRESEVYKTGNKE